MPRTLHLSEYGAGGAQPSGPANSGWPDSGVELAISLVLPATTDPAAAAAGGGVEARVGSGECVARVAAGAGALLLLLLLLLLPVLPPPPALSLTMCMIPRRQPHVHVLQAGCC